MSRRAIELIFLFVAGVIGTMAYVSVYASTYHTIRLSAIVYGLLFIAVFVVLHFTVRLWLNQADPYLLPLTAVLAAIGLTEVYRISPTLARLQGQWLLVGAALFIVTVVVVRDHQRLDRYRYLMGALGLGLLLLTIVAGTYVNGSKLWIRFAGFSIQPSEFAKIAIVLFLAGYLNDKKEVLSVPTSKVLGLRVPAAKYYLPLVLMWVLSLALLVFMKDFGMSLLMLSLFIAMLYMATSRFTYVVTGAILFIAGAGFAYRFVAHVQERFQIWIDPWSHAATTGYQLLQSLFTIADGGVIGAGLGRGYLLYGNHQPVVPYLQTDFIFTAIANEMGLLGAVGVILCYLMFCYRGFLIAVWAPDGFSKLLAAGLSAAFGLQTFIIIGGVTRLIPLTGVTLPFISYGGSSIVANLVLVALLLMVSHRTNVVRGGSETERIKLARLG